MASLCAAGTNVNGESYQRQLNELYRRGEHAAAVALCQQTLGEIRSHHDDEHPSEAIVLDNLANASCLAREYEIALATTQELLERDRASSGELSVDYIVHSSLLGFIYVRTQRLDEAERTLQSALASIVKLPEEQCWTHAYILLNLSRLQAARNDLPGAEKLLIQAMRMRLHECGWWSQHFGVMFYYLSNCFHAAGKQLAAERAVQKAIRICRLAEQTDTALFASMQEFEARLRSKRN